jgi:tetratricopeptide (TPR) repeat protein
MAEALVIAQSHLVTGRSAEAAAAYRSWLGQHPEELTALRGLQDARVAAGEVAEVLEEAEARAQARPEDPAAHYLLARARMASGLDPSAQLDSALGLDPGFTWAWVARCFHHSAGPGNDVARAMSCLRECLESPAAGPPCAAALGRYLWQAALGLEAYEQLRLARKRWPGDAELAAEFAIVQGGLGRHKEAVRMLAAALEARPAEARWWVQLAIHARATGAEDWRRHLERAEALGHRLEEDEREALGL